MIQKLFFLKADRGIVQLIRYGLVVAIAAPIDLGGYIILTSHFHVEYVLASAISFAVSLIANYILCVNWIWTEHTNRQKHKDALIFIMTGVVGLILTAFLIWLFTSILGIQYILAKLITFGFVFIWSFGSRRFLFTGRLLRRKVPPTGDAA